jgi:hypothetical protein
MSGSELIRMLLRYIVFLFISSYFFVTASRNKTRKASRYWGIFFGTIFLLAVFLSIYLDFFH